MGLNMDKTEAFAEAIYKTMEETHESVVENLSADTKFSNENYEFARNLYRTLNSNDKELFSRYIKGIFSDNIATILADFDGVSCQDTYPCEEIKISCDEEELKPWLSELFRAIFQEKNPNKQ